MNNKILFERIKNDIIFRLRISSRYLNEIVDECKDDIEDAIECALSIHIKNDE